MTSQEKVKDLGLFYITLVSADRGRKLNSKKCIPMFITYNSLCVDADYSVYLIYSPFPASKELILLRASARVALRQVTSSF